MLVFSDAVFSTGLRLGPAARNQPFEGVAADLQLIRVLDDRAKAAPEPSNWRVAHASEHHSPAGLKHKDI